MVISRDEALKDAMAEEAVKLIEDDSVIVLDIGTTPWPSLAGCGAVPSPSSPAACRCSTNSATTTPCGW
ncbi:hypothetical protein ACFQ10_18900 [Streptomyces indonesiensis]